MTLSRIKWSALLIIVALLVIVVFQNLGQVEVHLLFWTLSLPQAPVLSIAIALGVLLGLFSRELWRVRTRLTRRTLAANARDKADATTDGDSEH